MVRFRNLFLTAALLLGTAAPAIAQSVELFVVVDVGVTGGPTARPTFPKGRVVSYAYSPAPGFKDLAVTIDGRPAPARGTVRMDKDHTVKVTTKAVAKRAPNEIQARVDSIYAPGITDDEVCSRMVLVENAKLDAADRKDMARLNAYRQAEDLAMAKAAVSEASRQLHLVNQRKWEMVGDPPRYTVAKSCERISSP